MLTADSLLLTKIAKLSKTNLMLLHLKLLVLNKNFPILKNVKLLSTLLTLMMSPPTLQENKETKTLSQSLTRSSTNLILSNQEETHSFKFLKRKLNVLSRESPRLILSRLLSKSLPSLMLLNLLQSFLNSN